VLEPRRFRHVFFVTDLEGAAGVTDWSQTRKRGPRLDAARELLTSEINAVVEGLFPSRKELSSVPRVKVSVWDGHGHGGTVFADLDSRVEKFPYRDRRGFGGLLGHLLADEIPVDALGFIGQHAMAGSGGNLCHTYSSLWIEKYLLNGVEVGEFGARALLAWARGIPTIFLSGDDVACREASELVPGLVTVSVKRSRGVVAADSLSPRESCQALREGAGKILELDPCSSDLTPSFIPQPPHRFEKRYRRQGVSILRWRRATRGDDLRAVLRRV
jgi:D-amino peptidase